MIKGQRARRSPGSHQCDRCLRWGASVTEVRPSALRVCGMWWQINASVTDRRSLEPRLERSSHLDLGSPRKAQESSFEGAHTNRCPPRLAPAACTRTRNHRCRWLSLIDDGSYWGGLQGPPPPPTTTITPRVGVV